MELDGPAIVSGGCLSVLVVRAATGVSRAREGMDRSGHTTTAELLGTAILQRLGAVRKTGYLRTP